jgi:hypothetical protein
MEAEQEEQEKLVPQLPSLVEKDASCTGHKGKVEGSRDDDEAAGLLGQGERVDCRICHEEEDVARMEAPCSCSGSVKYAHRNCIQRWCDEKGNVKCEICGQDYRGFVAAERAVVFDGETIALEDLPPEIRGQIESSFLAHLAALQQPGVRTMTTADGVTILDVEDEYETAAATSAAWFRAAVLVLLSMLLLRHAFTYPEEDADVSLLSLAVLRVAAILLPCYVVTRVLSMVNGRRFPQEGSGASARARIARLIRARNVNITNLNLMNGSIPTDAPVAQNVV